MRHNPGHAGFTLVELLVVAVILAVIVALMLPAYFHVRSKAALGGAATASIVSQ